MKKLLTLIIGLTVLTGCSPSRQELMTSLAETEANLTEVNNELDTRTKELMEEKEHHIKEVEYLCALSVEGQTMGMVVYVGNKTFMDRTTGKTFTIDDMEKQCNDLVRMYTADVQKRSVDMMK